MVIEKNELAVITSLCEEFRKNNQINPTDFDKFSVKCGLRNPDGSGVLAGLSGISNVHGYVINEGERESIEGKLYYRGYNIVDIVNSFTTDERFGYEEVLYLLIFGSLPNVETLGRFRETLSEIESLPEGFFDDMILKAPSNDVMNKMARSTLALYSYDDNADDTTLELEILRALRLIGQMGNIMVKAYQVKIRYYDRGTMFLHRPIKGLSIAEGILSLLRPDREFTPEEAKLLDLCLVLHAEHGGGNNSTFACRVITSSGSDAYATYAAAIGSLKGPKHGGANIKVNKMVDDIMANVDDITSREQVIPYLEKILDKKANDNSGLIYGMGHAVYTISDPRASILRDKAVELANGTEYMDKFTLLQIIEQETPNILEKRGKDRTICANVDLYSGLVYQMLKIPSELFTPIFAVARMAGWTAHRLEELTTTNRIIRPAYKPILKPKQYIDIGNR